MMTARDNSNVFLMDQATAEERLKALTQKPRLFAEVQMEIAAGWVGVGIIVTGVALVWVLG